MDSPLTQQVRPGTFEPKVVQLYRQLFDVGEGYETEELIPPEGFWRELFLLRPEKQKFHDVLDPLTADQVLHLQYQTRIFFRRAIEEAGSAITPRNENALENLTGYLSAVLTKRYTNPSTDVIQVLAGLDTIDKLVTDLVRGLEVIIRSSPKLSFRQKAVDTSLAMVSGSYQTTLVTYFIHHDLFPALMRLNNDTEEPIESSLVLLGLLSNYNKFESQNIYQNRLEDFVDRDAINDLVQDFGHMCINIRTHYIRVQDDLPAPWTLNNTLSLIGLRALSTDQKQPPPTEEEAKILFDTLPPPEASTMLAAYSFVHANKGFTSLFLSSTSTKDSDLPLSAFLSATSYLCHHAHRSTRATHYAELSLLTIRMLFEDSVQLARLAAGDMKIIVRLARQRAPYLPYISSARIPATVILDICADTLTHNLRKRLSIPLYHLVLTILHRLVTHLDVTKTRLQHHWPYVWGSLISLLRFLTQYASELTPLYAVRNQICTPLVSLLAFCLSRGDNFLPDPASYDDLFYKLTEASAVLPKFREAFCPKSASTSAPSPANTTPSLATHDQLASATNALLSITSHFQSLLNSSGRRTHQSPATVQKIIKEGYDTLPDLQSTGVADGIGSKATGLNAIVDFGYREKYRESDWKVEIKKIVRTVVEDGRVVALKPR